MLRDRLRRYVLWYVMVCDLRDLGSARRWYFWYRNIYYANRDGSSIKWVMFFWNFFIHTVFTILVGVAIPGISGSGLFTMIKLFNAGYNVSGILALVATIIWGIDMFASIVLGRLAYTTWKFAGGDKQATGELAGAVAAAGVQAQINAATAPPATTSDGTV